MTTPLSRVLVPLDGSRIAEHALPAARALAERGPGGALHLVRIASSAWAGVSGTFPPLPEPADKRAVVERAMEYLGQVRERLEALGSGVGVSYRALPPGDLVEALIKEARDASSDVVVMTTHGRGAWARAWLGSVTDGMVRECPVPVLLIRPPETREGGDDPVQGSPPAFRKILVPLDGSDASLEALGLAVPMVPPDGNLTLFRAVPSIWSRSVFRGPRVPEGAGSVEEWVPRAREALEELAEPLRAQGISVEVAAAGVDEAAEGILRMAEGRGMDLVVMSTRGRGGAARHVLGSVADKVIRASNVPVLVRTRV